MTAADGKTFTYDSQNELASMNGGAVQVIYDGDGNRVAKAVTAGGVTTTTYYLVDDLNPTGLPQVMDELTNSVVTRTYTYGLQRISEDQIVSGAWTPSFYSYDGMGSVRQLTNTAGAVTDSYEYDAFGNQINHTGSTPNDCLYRGEQYDSDLGLYYLRARYYDPMTDRFQSRDAEDGNLTDPTSSHKYLYGEDDPVDLSDPTGRSVRAATAGSKPTPFEYLMLVTLISIPVAEKSLPPIACDINTLLTMGALGVSGYSEIAPDFPACSATGTAPPTPLPLPPIPLPLPGTPPSPDGSCQPGDHLHHMLPQNETMANWFADRGLDVNSPQFLRCGPANCHVGSGSIHGNQNGIPGTNWNALWRQSMAQNPDATQQEVLDFLQQLAQRFASQLNCK